MKQDHRVRITKMLLQESFVTLLREKPLSKITVREICDRAGINRATFYAHYHDLDALNKEIETELSDAIMNAVSSSVDAPSIESFCSEICRIIIKNWSWCETLFGENGDPDLPVRIINRIRAESIAAWKREFPEASDHQLDRLYTFAAHGSLAIISDWVRTGMHESPEEIAAFIGRVVPSCLAGL